MHIMHREQDAGTDRHGCMLARHDVADAPCGSEDQCLVLEGILETLGDDPFDALAHRQQRHNLAGTAVEVRRPMDREDFPSGVEQTDVGGGKGRVGQKLQIGEMLIGPTTERRQHRDPACSPHDCMEQRQFQVCLVLVDLVALDRDAPRLELSKRGRSQ